MLTVKVAKYEEKSIGNTVNTQQSKVLEEKLDEIDALMLDTNLKRESRIEMLLTEIAKELIILNHKLS